MRRGCTSKDTLRLRVAEPGSGAIGGLAGVLSGGCPWRAPDELGRRFCRGGGVVRTTGVAASPMAAASAILQPLLASGRRNKSKSGVWLHWSDLPGAKVTQLMGRGFG